MRLKDKIYNAIEDKCKKQGYDVIENNGLWCIASNFDVLLVLEILVRPEDVTINILCPKIADIVLLEASKQTLKEFFIYSSCFKIYLNMGNGMNNIFDMLEKFFELYKNQDCKSSWIEVFHSRLIIDELSNEQ